jgi:hypothetical protein
MDKPKPVVVVAAMGETAFEEKNDVRLLLQGPPVKHAGMALPDPTKSAESNDEASVLVASHLLAALRGTEAFRSTEHVAVIKAVRSELLSQQQQNVPIRPSYLGSMGQGNAPRGSHQICILLGIFAGWGVSGVRKRRWKDSNLG